jgi:hypothetical protein
MPHALRRHPESLCVAATRIEVDVAWPSAGGVVLSYVVHGDIAALRLPPIAAPARGDDLWQHTCFEAFIGTAAGAAYYELNFSPSTQWAAYRFDSHRNGMRVGVENLMNHFLGKPTTLAKLGGALAQFLVKGDERGIVLVRRLHLLHRHHDRGEEPLSRRILKRCGALLPLKEQLYAAEPALNLSDARDNAHRIENVRSGLVCVISLRNGEYEALALERSFDCAQRAGPTSRDRGGQTRKNHCPPKWKDRKSLALSHGNDLYELSNYKNATGIRSRARASCHVCALMTENSHTLFQRRS